MSGRLVAPDSAVAGCQQLHVVPQTCRTTQTRFCGRLSDPTRPGSRSASHHIHSVVFFVSSRSLRLLPFPSPPCACPFRGQRAQFIPFQLSRLSDTTRTATLQVVGSSAAGRVRVGSKYVPLPSWTVQVCACHIADADGRSQRISSFIMVQGKVSQDVSGK